jgi:hypothetical protein
MEAVHSPKRCAELVLHGAKSQKASVIRSAVKASQKAGVLRTPITSACLHSFVVNSFACDSSKAAKPRIGNRLGYLPVVQGAYVCRRCTVKACGIEDT